MRAIIVRVQRKKEKLEMNKKQSSTWYSNNSEDAITDATRARNARIRESEAIPQGQPANLRFSADWKAGSENANARNQTSRLEQHEHASVHFLRM